MTPESSTAVSPTANDLTRTTFAVMSLVLLSGATLWIARPFALPLVWGATIAIATWPILRTLELRLGERRWLATTVMVGVLLALLVVPVIALIGVALDHARDAGDIEARLAAIEFPPPPAWLADLPMIGERLATTWRELGSDGPEGLAARLTPYAGSLLNWLLAKIGGFGLLVFDFLLTTLFAAAFYLRGEVAGAAVRDFARRLAGDQGERAAVIAAQAVRGVALGVVVTALVQALVGGLGLLLAGIPLVGLLTAVMFLLSVAQIGAAPVLAIAALGCLWGGDVGWGIGLLLWTVLVGSLDNVLRPLLIRRGVDMPLFVIFAGVLGGLISFGVIGIFVGPVLLSIAFTLLREWTLAGHEHVADAETGAGSQIP